MDSQQNDPAGGLRCRVRTARAAIAQVNLAINAATAEITATGVAATVNIGGCGRWATVALTGGPVETTQMRSVTNAFSLNAAQQQQAHAALSQLSAVLCAPPAPDVPAAQWLSELGAAVAELNRRS